MERILEIENLTKRFGRVPAVDGVSITVGRGEIVSLLGPSGCGKTTTLRLIAGFERPDGGTIRIAGQDVSGRRPYERNVGLLFQNYALFPHMTVEGNIAYGLRHRGWRRPDIRARVEEMLALVKLTGFGARRPAELSGGQQQRVALARALAPRPQIVLLDEPLSALDAKLRQELRGELKAILHAVGSTAIIVTHDQEEAMGMAGRVVVMHRGRVVQEGTPEEIYWRPATRFVAEFVGRSNWLSGRCEARSNGTCEVVTDSGLRIAVPARPGAPGALLDVCIRPERIDLLARAECEPAREENRLAGRIVDVTHLGAERHFGVRLASGEHLLAVEPSRAERHLAVGQPVVVRFRAADCIVLPHGGEA